MKNKNSQLAISLSNTIILLLLTSSAFAQSGAACDCTIFPVKKDCEVYCLSTATVQQLQKGFNIDPKTAVAITRIPHRSTLKTLQEFKPYLPKSTYEYLFETIYDNSVIQNNSSGTNVAGNQTNNYYNYPPRQKMNSTPKQYMDTKYDEVVSDAIHVHFDHCDLQNFILTIHLTLENISSQPSLTLTYRSGDMDVTDENGNVYKSNQLMIGNMPGQKYGFTRYQLIKGTKVEVVATFPVGNDISRIARFEYMDGQYFYNIPVEK